MVERHPSWDKYEAAVLLEGLLAFIKGKLTHSDAIKAVSRDLRTMALHRGMEVDEVYRNTNGISFQMKSMESAYLGRTVFKPATKLFVDIVRLYKESNDEYKKLLEEASVMISGKKTVEEDFIRYLAERVSPAQLSEFYRCYPEIENFCLKIKVLKQPLFETTDFETIKKVQRNIEQNKIFRITHKRQIKNIVDAGRHYYNYVKESLYARITNGKTFEVCNAIGHEMLNQSLPDVEVAEKKSLITAYIKTEDDKRLFKEHPAVYHKIYDAIKDYFKSKRVTIREIYDAINHADSPAVIEKILDNVSWASKIGNAYTFLESSPSIEPDIFSMASLHSQDKTYKIDFHEDFDLAYTKPERFSYFGQYKVTGDSWTSLYTNVMAAVIEDYPNIFRPGMSFSQKPSRIELASNDNYSFMIGPKAIPGTSYMLETNLSANNIAAKIRYVLNLCNVDCKNIVITYIYKDKKNKDDLESTEKYIYEDYKEILKQYFKKGFRMDSPLEIRKFKRYYMATLSNELTDSDDDIRKKINQLCIIYEGKAFLPDVMLSKELKEKLLHYIDTAFADGKSAIYYQAIFTEFSDAFLDYHIYDADMLKAYLAFIGNGNFFINRSFISKSIDVNMDPLSEIRSCLQDYGRPATYNEIFSTLQHLPQSKIKCILASNVEFVNNGSSEYFHESILHLSSEELDGIAEIIQKTIDEKEFISGNELYDAICAKYPYIVEENHSLSMHGFRDAIKAKLGKQFSFKGNIISLLGQEISMADVFAKYARSHYTFTLSELKSLANSLATTIYFDQIYENSLRISRDQFIAKNVVQFPVKAMDEVLDRICTEKYIPISEVTNFGAFPYVGFPWNIFMLEHYVGSYSQKYKLLHSSFNGTECAGAIVKRSAGIDCFDDLVVDLLANNKIEMKKAPVLQFLSDKGYLARRRYSEIESLIIKANAQRQRKDTD